MLAVFGEDDVAGPVASAGELGVAGNVGNDRLGRPGGVEIAGMIRNALHGRGVADVDVPRVVSGIKGDAEGMVQASCELLDLCGFAVGADAAKDEDGSGAGIGEEEIAVGCGADEPRHRERAAAESHHLLVVRSLHRSGVAAGIKGDFETGGCDRPRIGGAGNNVRSVVDGLVGLGLGAGRRE